jgi:hypothetical protein
MRGRRARAIFSISWPLVAAGMAGHDGTRLAEEANSS